MTKTIKTNKTINTQTARDEYAKKLDRACMEVPVRLHGTPPLNSFKALMEAAARDYASLQTIQDLAKWTYKAPGEFSWEAYLYIELAGPLVAKELQKMISDENREYRFYQHLLKAYELYTREHIRENMHLILYYMAYDYFVFFDREEITEDQARALNNLIASHDDRINVFYQQLHKIDNMKYYAA